MRAAPRRTGPCRRRRRRTPSRSSTARTQQVPTSESVSACRCCFRIRFSVPLSLNLTRRRPSGRPVRASSCRCAARRPAGSYEDDPTGLGRSTGTRLRVLRARARPRPDGSGPSPGGAAPPADHACQSRRSAAPSHGQPGRSCQWRRPRHGHGPTQGSLIETLHLKARSHRLGLRRRPGPAQGPTTGLSVGRARDSVRDPGLRLTRSQQHPDRPDTADSAASGLLAARPAGSRGQVREP